MPLNDEVSFTWVGHGTWKARSAGGKEILFDPWVMNNPAAPDHLKQVDKLDLMLISHGHYDHIYDAVDIAQQTGCKVHAVFETAMWLNKQGLQNLDGGNKGGTHDLDGIKVTLVHAEHTCGISDPPSQMNNIVYGGEACGMVVEFENGFTVYFAGDTDVFGDMRLIAELHRLDAAFLPIDGIYNMDPRRTAKAVELLGAKTVVPTHWGPHLGDQCGTPAQLQELVGGGVQVLDIKPGDTI